MQITTRKATIFVLKLLASRKIISLKSKLFWDAKIGVFGLRKTVGNCKVSDEGEEERS